MIIAQDGDVALRELTEDDIPVLAEYANNVNVSRNLRDAFPHPYSVQDATNFITMVSKQNPVTFFAITYQGHYVGNISLLPGTDIHRKSAEIGYFIGEPFWNRGIATKAVSMIVQFGFATLDIVRIHAGVFEYNRASQKVLEKCGFTKEGIFKLSICKNEKLYDEVRYAIVSLTH
jgi:RimJ/RimL family protein N-acetyltransferase